MTPPRRFPRPARLEADRGGLAGGLLVDQDTGYAVRVPTADMLALREQGLDNRQIAAALGVSRYTVHKRIGPQPPAVSKANRRRAGLANMQREDRP